MIAIDTNVLVRIVVQDSEQQTQTYQAQALIKKAGSAFVPQMVQVELVWVLEAAYKFSKPQVVAVLQHLLGSSFYRLQREDSFSLALMLKQCCFVLHNLQSSAMQYTLVLQSLFRLEY